jgi:TM2 domain-containing membrane protein YozV
MIKKSKKKAVLYWLLFMFNLFGCHRFYLEGFKSKMFYFYLFLNIIYLVLVFTWSANSNNYDEIKQVLTILMYFVLLCFQIYDYQWINNFFLKLQQQNQFVTAQDVSIDDKVIDDKTKELVKPHTPHLEHGFLKQVILGKNSPVKVKKQKKHGRNQSMRQVNQSGEQQKNMLQEKSRDRPYPPVTSDEHSVNSNNFSKGQSSVQPKEDQISQLVELLKQSEGGMALSEILTKMEVEDEELFKTALNLQITLKSTPIEQKQNSDGIVIYYIHRDF